MLSWDKMHSVRPFIQHLQLIGELVTVLVWSVLKCSSRLRNETIGRSVFPKCVASPGLAPPLPLRQAVSSCDPGHLLSGTRGAPQPRPTATSRCGPGSSTSSPGGLGRGRQSAVKSRELDRTGGTLTGRDSAARDEPRDQHGAQHGPQAHGCT